VYQSAVALAGSQTPLRFWNKSGDQARESALPSCQMVVQPQIPPNLKGEN
jgi:hypothetical protein